MAKPESIVDQISESVAESVASRIGLKPSTIEGSLEALLDIKNLLSKMIDPSKTVQQDQKFPFVFSKTFEKVLSNLKDTSTNFKSFSKDPNKRDSNVFFDAVSKIPSKIEEKISNKVKDVAYSFVPKAIKSKVLSFTGAEQEENPEPFKDNSAYVKTQERKTEPNKSVLADTKTLEQSKTVGPTNNKSDLNLPSVISKGFKSVVEAINSKTKSTQTSSDTSATQKSILESKAQTQKVEVTNFKELTNILPSVFNDYFKKINTNLKEMTKLLKAISEKDFGGEGGSGLLDALRFLPGRKGAIPKRNTRARNKKAAALRKQRTAYKAGTGPKPTLPKSVPDKPSSIPKTKTPTIIKDTLSKAGKGLSKAAPILGKVGGVATGALFAGMEYAGRKSEGQSTTQAAVGTGAGVAGAAAGAVAGQLLIPIPIVGAVIGGIVGGWLAGKLADKAMGVDDPVTRWKNRTESTLDGKKLIEAFGKLPKDKQKQFEEILAPTLENPEVIAPTDEIIRAELNKMVAFEEKEKKAKAIETLPPITPSPVKEAVADQTLKTKEIPVTPSTASVPLEKPEQKFTPIAMDKVPPITKEVVKEAVDPQQSKFDQSFNTVTQKVTTSNKLMDLDSEVSKAFEKRDFDRLKELRESLKKSENQNLKTDTDVNEFIKSAKHKAPVNLDKLSKSRLYGNDEPTSKTNIQSTDNTKAIQSSVTENKLKDTVKSVESNINNEALKQTATESTKQTQLLSTLVGNMNENFGRIASAFREAGINFKEVRAPIVVQQNTKKETEQPEATEIAKQSTSPISDFRMGPINPNMYKGY